MSGTADCKAVRRPAKPQSQASVARIDSGGHRARVLGRRDDLVRDHLALVRQIAESVHRHLPPSFLLEDLVATGNLALTRAATRYRPAEHGAAPFSAFARPAIRGAMIETVRRKNWQHAQHERLDLCRQEDRAEVGSVAPADVVIAIDSERLRKRVRNAAELLPDEHRRLLAVYYSAEEPTLLEAARWMKISLRRASELHREAVDQLRLLLREPA